MVFSRVWAFVELTRPLFLFGGVLLYGLGAVIARSAGMPLDGGRYALGQVIVTSIQMMTQYANEYFDLPSDRLVGASRTWFSGGSGVLPAGRLRPRVALNAARVMALFAVTAIAIAIIVEPVMSAIGVIALLGGWFYSAPPLRLVASGLGELTTALLVGFLAPLGGAVMQRGSIDMRLLAVSLPMVMLIVAMLIVFEFSDYETDRQAGKRNLVVRIGRRRAARLHGGLMVAALVWMWVASRIGWIDPRVADWTWVALPLAVWQFVRVLRWADRDGRGYGLLTAGGLGLFALTATLFLAGFLFR
jgi:1,4-dihydroxy-2-naphthoate octaprenyltransferase